jgi:iron(III) transport system substrate-binding protein
MRRATGGRALVAALAGLLLAGGLSACGSDEDRLTVYSGRSKDLIGPLLDRFADESGIGIDVRYDDTANLALLIDTEGGRSPADVFISQSPGAVAFLEARNRLAPLPEDVLSEVAERDRSSDGTWVGLTGRVRTLVYNTEQVDPAELPASVLDLTGPDFDGRLGVAPSNGSFQDFVTALRVELGEERTRAWLEGIAANDPATYPNNVSILEAVGRGEIDFGLINHYYDYRAKEEDPDLPTALEFFRPGDLGSLLLVTAASVVDTADQDDPAQRLVRFLLSDEAQGYFSEETYEFPLVAGVEPAEGLPPLEDIASTRIDLERLADLERTEELIGESGLADA